MPRALEIARTICEASPAAIRASKEVAARLAAEKPLSEAYAGQEQGAAVQAMLASTDMREGPAAFAEKRLPRWSGV
jgi:enoyl-CoA hydratase/carnithine racemase